MLGGGSSINFMMYTRAQGVDFDDWETKGWSADDLLPLMKRVCCPNS
jgi:alcohol oxidase